MRNYSILSFLLFQSIEANTGIPTIVMFEPILILILIPIIFIEYKVMQKYLPRLKNIVLVKSASISNVFSTFIGFPIAWITMLIFQVIYEKIIPLHKLPFEPAWLAPLVDLGSGESYTIMMYLMIGFSLLCMTLAHFSMSYWIEYFIARKIIKETEDIDAKSIKFAVRNANVMSYAFLILFSIVYWLYMFYVRKIFCGEFLLIDTSWLWLFSFKTVDFLRQFI